MKKLFIMMTAMLPIFAASCSKEDVTPSDELPTEIRLSTGIEVQSRTAFPQTDTQIAEGEDVAVWVDYISNGKEQELYSKNILTADGSGRLSGGQQMFFPQKGENINIYALHTNASLSNVTSYPKSAITHTVSSDQRELKNYASSDLLYATAKNIGKTSKAIPLTFHHLLSKVQVAITIVDDLDYARVKTVKLGGLKRSADIMLSKSAEPDAVYITASGQTGTIEIGNDISADYTPEEAEYNEAVVVPQTVAADTEFVMIALTDGSSRSYRLPSDLVFESGKKYQLHLAVASDGVTLITNVSDWEQEDFIMHFVITYTDLSTEDVYAYKSQLGKKIEIDGLGRVVRSISLPDYGKTYLIGRRNMTSFDFNFTADGDLRFRRSDDDYIPIGSFAELQLINTLEGALAGYYKQEANIDLMSEPWTAIGSSDKPFTGIYDGGNFNIERINIKSSSDYQGFFGYIEGAAEICNVNITSGIVDCSNRQYIGSICGYSNGGNIRHCSNAVAVKGRTHTGGIVGYSIYGQVEHCHNTGAVSSSSSSNSYSGGIVGYNSDNTAVTACYNTGAVSSSSSYNSSCSYSGGIVGYNSNNTAVTACYNTGAVSASAYFTTIYSYSYSGGIVGYNSNNTAVTACYNTGAVSASAYNYSSSDSSCSYSGGIAGEGGAISCYWKTGTGLPSQGVGSGSGTDILSFKTSFTPNADKYPQWGIGNGEENGWWKNYDGNNGLPQLWWED